MNRMSLPQLAFRLTVFTSSMLLVLAGLTVVLGQFRFEDYTNYEARFVNVSGLTTGEMVRVAGVEVGKVTDVRIQPDSTVLVDIDVDADYTVTTSTSATIRYLNLVGDRYLELSSDAVGTQIQAGGMIDVDRTSPALDLDLLVGSFKPLFRALDPEQVNNLSADLIAMLQGQGGTVESILIRTASLTSTIADRDLLVGSVVENLNMVLESVSGQREQFGVALDRAQGLASGLARDSSEWGTALERIDTSAATITELLAETRDPLSGTIAELGRTAAQLDEGKDTIDSVASRLPDAYAALARLGSYGGFFNYYLCGLNIKLTGLDGEPFSTPFFGQTTGRCAAR